MKIMNRRPGPAPGLGSQRPRPGTGTARHAQSGHVQPYLALPVARSVDPWDQPMTHPMANTVAEPVSAATGSRAGGHGAAQAADAGAESAAPAPGLPAGWSLRLRINLIVATLMGLFVAALFWMQVDDTRRSVHEEITGGNRVAAQLLQRVSWVTAQAGVRGLQEFLTQLGRVRANDITLTDSAGQMVYRSPPSPYKAGRAAPGWYSDLVAPPLQRQEIVVAGGHLVVEADPSRAILDGWDDFWKLATAAGVVLLLLNLGVFWLVGRTLAPLGRIEQALARIRSGDWRSRLPALPGREAARMGEAVNRMADALQGQLDEQKRAWQAERSLDDSRALAWQIEQHMEAERREIARELHDELGQSVTAIRTLAATLVQRLPADARGQQDRELAALIGAEAGRLDDAMHGLIPRLAPLSLDGVGLVDALADLVDGARQREPQRRITLTLDAPQRAGRDEAATAVPAAAEAPGHEPQASRDVAACLPVGLRGELTLTAYRVAQEGLNNALRHSGASTIEISLGRHGNSLAVQVLDNGQGLVGDPATSARFGLRGLRERVRALGGDMSLGTAAPLPGAGSSSHAKDDAESAGAGAPSPIGAKAGVEDVSRGVASASRIDRSDESTGSSAGAGRGCRLRVLLPLGDAVPAGEVRP
jgi:two-component system sensor histidine kinase UhpB